MSLWHLLIKGGIAVFPLAFFSILVIAVVLERMWTFSHIGKAPKELIRRVENLITSGEWQEAIRLLDESTSPFARVVKASLMRKHASQQEIADILTLACDAEISSMTRPLPVLGTIGNIAPFVGLFGTVLGIMNAFNAIANSQTAGLNVVINGIAEALIATAAGLAVGIIAVISNNWCNAWVERYRLELERFSTEWSYRLDDLLTNRANAGKEPAGSKA